jgi:5-methyltetrahydropteroyltriglutamate--homocysteine methyltransferase
VIDQKQQHVETVEEVLGRAQHAVEVLGAERVLLTTDCGFATFADSPIVTAELAEAKLHVLAQVRDALRHN